jgi:RHS repeat-associated protein
MMNTRLVKKLCAGLLLAGLLATPAQAETVTYLHTDLLGSVVLETDQNRNIVQRYEYEPYGLPRQAMVDQPGYTGHVHDAGSGLVYMQQRYYDPEVGRFLSIDPVTASAINGTNFNRYWYANNNPYKYRDPDGRFADIILDAGFIAYSAYTLATDPSWTNAAALGADVVGAVVPFATGLGAGVRAAAHGADAARAAGAVNDTVSATRKQALANAKEANGIPRSAQPDSVIKPGTPEGNAAGLDSRNVRQYEYTNSKGEKISIREDKPASYPDGGSQPAHLNAGKSGEKLEQHHYIDDKRR